MLVFHGDFSAGIGHWDHSASTVAPLRMVLWWKLKLLDSDLSLRIWIKLKNCVSCPINRMYFQLFQLLQTQQNITKCHCDLRYFKIFSRRRLVPVQPFFSQSAVSTLEALCQASRPCGLDICSSHKYMRTGKQKKTENNIVGKKIWGRQLPIISVHSMIINYTSIYVYKHDLLRMPIDWRSLPPLPKAMTPLANARCARRCRETWSRGPMRIRDIEAMKVQKSAT